MIMLKTSKDYKYWSGKAVKKGHSKNFEQPSVYYDGIALMLIG